MPTTLSKLIRQRLNTDQFGDDSVDNLEKGKIFVFSPGNIRTNFCNGFCWKAPGTGCAIIEVWGAGGSASRMACCSASVPGNAGAYSKKCITVTSACYVTGIIGFSCGTDSGYFRGCSESTRVCWFGSGSDGCICAQGGRAGCGICVTDGGCAPFCCFKSLGYCASNNGMGSGCGTVCNIGAAQSWIACAYGGDFNCCGQPGCTTWYCTRGFPAVRCCLIYHVPGPAGVFGCGAGPIISYSFMDDATPTPIPGAGTYQFMLGLSALTNSPSKGGPRPYQWRSDRMCSCYEAHGCIPYIPYGFGGPGDGTCDNVCSAGTRGGMGAVRIRFYT